MNVSRKIKISPETVRVIACGMIAREILAIRDKFGLDHLQLTCLPAEYHHYPDKIAPSVDQAIVKAKAEGVTHIFIGYADCGTGGRYAKSKLQGARIYRAAV